jgi:hypothetical protein
MEYRDVGGNKSSPIGLDVLIIGGGIMGLWLLNDLRRARYTALLLERRELGGEQTCHSHVYIHQGHLYRDVELAEHLKNIQPLWDAWLGSRTPQYEASQSFFGFASSADAQQKTNFWSDPRLRLAYTPIAPRAISPALQGGAVRVVRSTPERCLNGAWLMSELSQSPSVSDCISRIQEVTAIRIDLATETVTEVEVLMANGARLTFQPGALVLTAGMGNQPLLDLASGGRSALLGRMREAQQIRKGHMLIVRGEQHDLPPLTGVFPSFGGLFIVSRMEGDDTVWLISDNRSPLSSVSHDWITHDVRWWLPRVLTSLRDVAPNAFSRPERLYWGIYEAPKAEGRQSGLLPSEERIEQFGLRNLWAVWPSKLTLAPEASRVMLEQIRKLIPPPRRRASLSETWDNARVPARIAPERWTTIPLVAWGAFRRLYDL